MASDAKGFFQFINEPEYRSCTWLYSFELKIIGTFMLHKIVLFTEVV